MGWRHYLVQHEWNGNESYADECQCTRCPSDSEVAVHRGGEQWEASTYGRTHKIVACEYTSGVFRVSVWQVVEDAVEEKEGADREECRSCQNVSVQAMPCSRDNAAYQ